MYFRQNALDVTSELRKLLALQKTDDEQFLCEIPVATSVPDATRDLVELQNLRTRIHRYLWQKAKEQRSATVCKIPSCAILSYQIFSDSQFSG